MLKFIAKVFGTKSDKDVKKLMPIVEEVNSEFANLSGITDQQLREKTREVRAQIDEYLKDIDDQIKGLYDRINENPDLDINEKEDIELLNIHHDINRINKN